MSMTQMAFLKKTNILTNGQIQDAVQKMGYDFQILCDLEKLIDHDGLECSINGHRTCFETSIDTVDNAIADIDTDWLNQDLSDQDTAISFIWSSDFAAGACIGLISLVLIDQSKALIYYLNDQMKYEREMLLADIPQYLEELANQTSREEIHQESINPMQKSTQNKYTFLDRIKSIFK